MTSSSSESSEEILQEESRLLPFTIEFHKENPSLSVDFYKDFCFIGTGSNGEILRSKNRFHWGIYYKTNDVFVSSLLVNRDDLFAGTSPLGKIYRFDLTNDNVYYYDEMNSGSIGFVNFQNNIYSLFNNGNIYQYDRRNDNWIFFYKSHNKINTYCIFDNNLFLGLNGENIIRFDGEKWEVMNWLQNIPSVNKVEYNQSINRKYTRGINCLSIDGSSMMGGSVSNSKVYRFLKENNEYLSSIIFESDESRVNDIMNLKLGVNLSSIGNKLYFMYSGPLVKEEPEEIKEKEKEEQVETESKDGKNIVVTFPMGGEQLEIGQNITIQWSSTRNFNDAIKIELYKGSEFFRSIATRTTNDGSFGWSIPLDLPVGNDYRVNIEWLSPGGAEDIDKDISGNFELLYSIPETTTTTTKTVDPSMPDISMISAVPILSLPYDEYITKMTKDDFINGVLLLTSKGRILECKEAVTNAYFTGHRKLWATVKSGLGFKNDTYNDFIYALKNRIIEINKDKKILNDIYVEKAAITHQGDIRGIFISPILYVPEDIGFWKSLSWNETVDSDMEVIVHMKSSNSIDALQREHWEYNFVSDNGSVEKDLQEFNIKGRFAQIKIELVSRSSISPIVGDLTLVYTSKKASYFFTNQFSLNSESNKGLIVANMTDITNTEVIVGISDKNSNDWNDYKVVPLEKFFDLDNYKSVKVGLKMITYDDENVPVFHGFALMVNGEELTKINEE